MKDEFVTVVAPHNVSGTDITANEITDEMVSEFNTKFKEFLKKYPDFDIFLNDYEGAQDDEVIEILIDVLKSGNLSIV